MFPAAREYCAQCVIPHFSGSGPLHLWKFLLGLLMDKSCQNCISWTGDGWEFQLTDPEEVAKRWGRIKNRPAMNYEKLSRAIRYYYKRGVIHKTVGKKYVYRYKDEIRSSIGFRNCSTRSECAIKFYKTE